MEPDPQTSANLLFTINYFSNELFTHFNNKEAIGILRDKARNLKIID